VGTDVRRWNGSSWSLAYSPPRELYDVHASAPDNVWAVGSQGLVVRWNGVTWSVVNAGGAPLPDYNGVFAVSSTNVWAVGDNGVIGHWDGTSWSTVAPVLPESLYRVLGATASHVWALGANGTILFYDGSSWTNRSMSSLGNSLYAGAILDPNNLWIGGAGEIGQFDGTVFQLREPLVWETWRGIFAVGTPGGPTVFAVTNTGAILRHN